MLIKADARHIPLADGCIQCCVTSPPYWGLRDYGTPGQLGLEKTPEEYVANMVAVFCEVRRVLKDDGVLWLNLGDSYIGGGRAGKDGKSYPSGIDGNRINRGCIHGKPTGKIDGLKPKDLVGIPWLVAKALQAPYYTGRIKDEVDRAWLAAMLDAEGCLFIHRRKAGQHNGQGYYRQNDSYGPGVEIANTSLPVIERIMALVGKGSICSQGPEQNGRRKQTIYRWNLRTVESKEFVRELYPHLIAKRQQARILYGCPSSGERAAAAHLALIALHRKGVSDVDFPEPPSMFEPGWYLRSDVIWSKCNPMPESVTDRPTKAHEYIFLMSKSARYFYNADAIAERAIVGCRDTDFLPNSSKDKSNNGMHTSATGASTNRTGKFIDTRNRRTVWTIPTQPYHGSHFATFPEEIPRLCILAGSRPGDVVLDPFGGSGTTAKVALELGRKPVHLDLGYHDLARSRATTTPALVGVFS